VPGTAKIMHLSIPAALFSHSWASSTLRVFFSMVLADICNFLATAFDQDWPISAVISSTSCLRCLVFSRVQATLIAPWISPALSDARLWLEQISLPFLFQNLL